MSYIGATPAESYASFYVQHFTTSATTSYALDYPVVNENDLRLVINNVVQQPGTSYAYTAAASTLTLSAATTTSDTMYTVFLGRALQTVNPPADSVGGSQLADTAISGQTALGAEPADTDEFLVSDAGTLKRMDYSYIKAGAGGKLGQVVSTAKTDTFTDTTASTWIDITGMSVAITPVAATSKILICWNVWGSSKTNNLGNYKIVRDINGGGYADFAVGDADGNRQRSAMISALLSTDNPEIMSMMFLDSPTWTTGAITYKGQIRSDSDWMGINRTYTDSDSIYTYRGISTITAMEILA